MSSTLLTRRHFGAALGASAASLPFINSTLAAVPTRKERIRVLLLTGQNNHDWRRTSLLMSHILLETDRFELFLSATPEQGAKPTAWDAWKPNFKRYDVVLMDYNGDAWPDPVKDSFVQFVADGGRVVVQHAANNAFTGWKEYESMVGLLWRNADYGWRVYFDEAGNTVRVPPNEGPSAGHGPLYDWHITAPDDSNPILKDLPQTWLHAHDELYHGQRGPAENLNILATAFSDKDKGGTGRHEPMLWWVPFESGKVITFLPGHLWENQKDDRSFRCVGFRTVLQRCTEWVATDEVTIPVPDDFPTEDAISVRKLGTG